MMSIHGFKGSKNSTKVKAKSRAPVLDITLGLALKIICFRFLLYRRIRLKYFLFFQKPHKPQIKHKAQNQCTLKQI